MVRTKVFEKYDSSKSLDLHSPIPKYRPHSCPILPEKKRVEFFVCLISNWKAAISQGISSDFNCFIRYWVTAEACVIESNHYTGNQSALAVVEETLPTVASNA